MLKFTAYFFYISSAKKLIMKVFIFRTLFLVFFAVSFTLHSQKIEYSAFTIPVELKENANAVIRSEVTTVTVNSVSKMTVNKKKVVTVLNKLGNVDAGIAEGYDNDTKITKLSAKIYNAFGEQIKKYSKGKFLDVSAVSGGTLYSDARVKYIDYTPNSYPYTLVFESEYTTSSTGFVPGWFPTNGYMVSVENSEYRFNNPTNTKVRIKERNFKEYEIVNLSTDNNLYYKLESLKGIKHELSSIPSREFMPLLIVGLNHFSLKKTEGRANSWKEFGKWRYEYLNNGKDELSEVVKIRAKRLVEGINDPIEKAKIIYKYMQDRTRYISVQEGIGGWKPIPANEVDKVGYGDCKGLTNYTKALLDAVGVESYYTVLWAGKEKRNVYKDFFSMQGNHVILNLPNENGNDIWLECTSQTIPFGFLGDFTDDRDVLVITPEGGVIKHTTSYKNEQNLQKIKASLKLETTGNLSGEVEIKSEGIQYDNKYFLDSYSQKEKEEFYISRLWSYNNNLSVKNIDIKNDKDKVEYKENLKIAIKEYATESSGKLLLRVNVLNRNTNVPKRYRKRKMPLKISRGYKDVDEFEIELPKGYQVDGELFQDINLTNKFGAYTVSIEKISENKLLYKRSLLIKDGQYPKEDYKKYRSFRRKVAKHDNIRIAITKTN